MTCPACAQDTPAEPIVATLTVCQSCARSLVVVEGVPWLATADDLRNLSAAQVTDLRKARPAAWRNDVRARHARIVARR